MIRVTFNGYENFEGSININDIPGGNYDLNCIRKATGILLQQQDILKNYRAR
jgi:ABC-type bacteriocin/lantibiotic exporter with double-glycine peptidase domain